MNNMKIFKKYLIIGILISYSFSSVFAEFLAVPGISITDHNVFQERSEQGLVIFVPAEIKKGEGRVALTPQGVKGMLEWAERSGFSIKILVESGAGKFSKATDEEYEKAGAIIVKGKKNIEQAYRTSDIIDKVKEPLKAGDNEKNRDEFDLMREMQIWLTYFHLPGNRELTESVINKKIIALALETIKTEDSNDPYPCLSPMSIAAGWEAIFYSILFKFGAQISNGEVIITEETKNAIFANFPETKYLPPDFSLKYKGTICKSPLKKENIAIFGGGVSGRAACDLALRFDAGHVTIIEKFPEKIALLENKYRQEIQSRKVTILDSNDSSKITGNLMEAGIIITATYIDADSPEIVLTKSMLKDMKDYDARYSKPKPRIIIVIDIDQGGGVEFVNMHGKVEKLIPRYHDAPACLDYYGNIICPVANLPGMQNLVSPITTRWLEEARMPYLKNLVASMHGNMNNKESIKKGLRDLVNKNPGIKTGINIMMGDVTKKPVADHFNLLYTPLLTSL